MLASAGHVLRVSPAFWAVIVCISSLLTDGSGGASVSYSSGQRTMLIFMVLVLCVRRSHLGLAARLAH